MSLRTLIRELLPSRSPTPSDASPRIDAEGVELKTPKWHSDLVLICEKCGKKVDSEARLSLDLKDQVKRKLVAAGKWGPVRVVTSSCLDLCPEGKIAVGFTGDSGRRTEVAAVHPEKFVDWVLKKLESRLSKH